jgi:rRNA maturation protein Nop10
LIRNVKKSRNQEHRRGIKMPYTFSCKKCGKPTQLIRQYCEECLIKVKHIATTKYAEHPKMREAINKLLKEHPDLSLFQIAFSYEFDHPPIFLVGNMQKQARKMLQETLCPHCKIPMERNTAQYKRTHEWEDQETFIYWKCPKCGYDTHDPCEPRP